MSVQAMSEVFALQGVTSTEKLVLLALANYAHPRTGECWPSTTTLAEDTSLNPRTVQSTLKRLVELGMITRAERTRRNGSRTSDLITIHVGETTSGHPVADADKRGEPDSPPDPPGNQKKEMGVQSARGGFDAWWLLYPRKLDKAEARLAFAKALLEVDEATLCQATVRFADEVKDRPRDKIPHPTTWLNRKRWEDEPEANRSQTDARRDQPADYPDRGAARANAKFDAMVTGAREALDRRSAERAEQRRRWGFSDPPRGDQPDPAGGGRAALPAPAGGGEGEA